MWNSTLGPTDLSFLNSLYRLLKYLQIITNIPSRVMLVLTKESFWSSSAKLQNQCFFLKKQKRRLSSATQIMLQSKWKMAKMGYQWLYIYSVLVNQSKKSIILVCNNDFRWVLTGVRKALKQKKLSKSIFLLYSLFEILKC